MKFLKLAVVQNPEPMNNSRELMVWTLELSSKTKSRKKNSRIYGGISLPLSTKTGQHKERKPGNPGLRSVDFSTWCLKSQMEPTTKRKKSLLKSPSKVVNQCKNQNLTKRTGTLLRKSSRSKSKVVYKHLPVIQITRS